MFFVGVSILVPLAVYFLLPPIIEKFSGKSPLSRHYLIIAGLLFFISWYLPSPLIEGNDTSFTTHFVGGGLFTSFLWLHLKNQLHLKINPLVDLIALYFLVCTLGVTNELFELATVKSRLTQLSPNDTWWDLLANTLGILTFWIIYVPTKKLLSKSFFK